LILLTLLFGSYDLYRHFQSGGPWLSSVGQFWSEMHPVSLSQVQAFFEPRMGVELWYSLLSVPMIAVIGAVAIAFLVASLALRLRGVHS